MTGKRQWYRGYGLTIASEFEIPGAVPVMPDTGQPDIVIRAGKAAIEPVEATNGPYSRSGDALLLDVPNVARYCAASASEMVIAPYPAASAGDVSALLVATGLPMLLWMRGGMVLHAAGLIMPGSDSAIALAGPSGVGKSSLVHRLLGARARMVGDDTLLMSVADGRSMVSGLPSSYFLPGETADQRVTHPVPPALQAESAPLRAIIVLTSAEQAETRPASRLTGMAALEAILQNRHRPRIPAIIGRDGAILAASAQHCRNVPIYALEIPNDNIARAQVLVEELIAIIHEAG